MKDITEKQQSVKKIWRECFNDTPQWIDMYFSRVYNDDDAFVLTKDDKVVSSLLLLRYKMNFHGELIPVSYVSGAATRPHYRGNGNMTSLMTDAIRSAYDRGDVLMTLIPAQRRLYFYYDKFNFSTVFYIDEERYTPLHSFDSDGAYSVCDIHDADVYETFSNLLMARNCSIAHSGADFDNILEDNRLDGGKAIALRDDASGNVAAIVIGHVNDDRLVISELLAVSDDARNAAINELRKYFPHMPITVIAPPDNRRIPVHARGMARIVNVKKLFEVYARRYPRLKMAIRVSDPIIENNNHIYIIDNGEVVINDGFGGRLDLDVTIDVLTSIVFSQEQIGEIFNLPTARPYISLMMD